MCDNYTYVVRGQECAVGPFKAKLSCADLPGCRRKMLGHAGLASLISQTSCTDTDTDTRDIATEIQRVPVSSTAMNSVGYDQSAHVLEIEFAGGEVYQYYDVPRRIYDGLMSAESHGRYFHQHIRNARFRYRRVAD